MPPDDPFELPLKQQANIGQAQSAENQERDFIAATGAVGFDGVSIGLKTIE